MACSIHYMLMIMYWSILKVGLRVRFYGKYGVSLCCLFLFFFFNDTTSTEIYTV